MLVFFIIGFFFSFASASEYDVGGGIGVNINAGNVSQNQSNNQVDNSQNNTTTFTDNNHESNNRDNHNINLNENTEDFIKDESQNSGINEKNKISENSLIVLSKNSSKNNGKQEINKKFLTFSLVINLFLLLALAIMLIKSQRKLIIKE